MKTDYVTKKAISLINQLHAPTIGATEFSGGWSGERCDAILFNSSSSFMIEVKVSRSDFFADFKKPFRKNPRLGVGSYRYYACPVGMIKPEELPEKWGLIYAHPSNKRCTMPVGYGGYIRNPKKDTKHPVHGWAQEGYDTFGSIMQYEEMRRRIDRGEDCSLEETEHPRSLFRFDTDDKIERDYVYSLATRYKSGAFPDNII